MLRRYSNSRTLKDNIQLGSLTAFAAGMVNIVSLIIFFAFTSNVTGHYAILASEIVQGNLFQVAIVFLWIFLFFLGSFISNFIVIHLNKKVTYLAHALPLGLEILCLLIVGIYGQFFYSETLAETEILVAIMLFSMGLQNGLTASISNFLVKTTHLTGATTDLGILFSMFTRKEYRENKELKGRALLLLSIMGSYMIGAVVAGLAFMRIGFMVFFAICAVLVGVIIYDAYKIRLLRKKIVSKRQAVVRIDLKDFNIKGKLNPTRTEKERRTVYQR